MKCGQAGGVESVVELPQEGSLCGGDPQDNKGAHDCGQVLQLLQC